MFNHVSVLLHECVSGLNIKPFGIYADGTAGKGGHSFEIAARLTEGGHLYSFDRDEDAIAACTERLLPHRDRVSVIKSEFSNIPDVLSDKKLDGLLLDLGVSSYQLDSAERGFAYMKDAPLDMRMDRSAGKSAYHLVNELSENELAEIFFKYGEERYSKRIAVGICKARQNKPVATTFELVDIIKASVPTVARQEKQHPAKRVFQALRIAVNDELGELERLLDRIPSIMADGGRLCIITFHSLEDRIVKEKFIKFERPCTCPSDFPICICGKKPLGECVTHKPIAPSSSEVEANPRARSAKLRIFEFKDKK